MAEKTFLKITNRDIFKKLEDIEVHVLTTNGKVKMNYMISRAALILSLAALGILTGIKLSGGFIGG